MARNSDDTIYREHTTIPIDNPPGTLISGQAAIQFKDEGVALGTPGSVIGVDAVGAGVVATRVGDQVTLTISGAVSDADKGDITVSVGGTVWTIDNDVVTFAKMQNIATDRLLGRDTAASGDPEELTVGGGVEFTGSGGVQTAAFTGDVTKTAGGIAQTIANDAVTYAKMQNVSAASRLLGRGDSGSGDPQEIVLGTNITMSGTTINAAGGSVADADYGDITVSGGGTVWNIDSGVVGETELAVDAVVTTRIKDSNVTFAKIQAVSADILLGNDAAGTVVEEISCTAAGRAILDDADAAAQRTTLGLGTIATQDADSVIISGGSVDDVSLDSPSWTNASIVGITGTKAQFDTAVTDGNILYVGDAPTVHAASHKLGGSDVILLNEFGNPTASVEFNQQQALQFRLENRTSDPGSPAVGECWLRTDL